MAAMAMMPSWAPNTGNDPEKHTAQPEEQLVKDSNAFEADKKALQKKYTSLVDNIMAPYKENAKNAPMRKNAIFKLETQLRNDQNKYVNNETQSLRKRIKSGTQRLDRIHEEIVRRRKDGKTGDGGLKTAQENAMYRKEWIALHKNREGEAKDIASDKKDLESKEVEAKENFLEMINTNEPIFTNSDNYKIIENARELTRELKQKIDTEMKIHETYETYETYENELNTLRKKYNQEFQEMYEKYPKLKSYVDLNHPKLRESIKDLEIAVDRLSDDAKIPSITINSEHDDQYVRNMSDEDLLEKLRSKENSRVPTVDGDIWIEKPYYDEARRRIAHHDIDQKVAYEPVRAIHKQKEVLKEAPNKRDRWDSPGIGRGNLKAINSEFFFK